MADKITMNYNVTATGLLAVCDGRIYISMEDGPQDVDVATLLSDFDGKSVKLTCAYKSEYSLEESDVDEETGELLDL